MSIINKFTLRSMLHYKKRTLGALLGIILSSALMFSFGLAFSSLRGNIINNAIDTIGNYHFRYREVSYRKINILKRYDKINYLAVTTQLGSFIADEEDKTYNYVIGADDLFFKNIKLSSGRMPQNDQEIIVTDNYYKKNKLSIYDNITLNLSNYEGVITKQYVVVGTYVDKISLRNVVNDVRVNSVLYTLVNEFDSKDLVNFDIKFKKVNMGIYDIASAIANYFGFKPYIYNGATLYQNMDINEHYLEMYLVSDTNYIEIAVIIFSLMMVSVVLGFVCFFVIFNSFAISVNERKKMFGVLASVGATGKQMFKSVFFESLINSLIGIPIGFGLSVLLNYGIINYINNSLGDILDYKIELSFFWLFIIIQLLFIMATIFLSTLFPAMRAKEVMPIEAIRQYDDYKFKRRTVKTNKLFLKVFGIEGELARKNMKRNARKYRVTLISLITCVLLFVTFSTFLKFLLKVVDYEYQYTYDVSIGINKEHEQLQEIIDDIKKIPIIDEIAITKGWYYPIDIDLVNYYTEEAKQFMNDEGLNLKNENIYIITYDDDSYQDYLKKLDLKKPHPILISPVALASEYGIDDDVYFLDTKQKIEFNICTKMPDNDPDKQSCTIKVDNIKLTKARPLGMPDGIMAILVLPEEEMQKIGKSPYPFANNYVSIYINSKRHNEFDNYMNDIQDKYKLTNKDFYYHNFASDPYIVRTLRILRTIKICLYLIIGFIGLIGITSIYNTISTSLNLRRREFGILRSIGLSPIGFSKIILYESIFLSLKTLFYAIPISIGVIYVIFKIMHFEDAIINQDSYGLTKVMFPIEYFIMSFIIVFIVVFITMYFASKKYKEDNLADVLKENF